VADHQEEFQRTRVTLAIDAPETPIWVNGDTTRPTQSS
jgi:hypothetical protein